MSHMKTKITTTNDETSCLASKCQGPIFMFGVQVPRNEKEAHELDQKNAELGLPK